MKTGFRAFFLLVQTIIEIRKNFVFKKICKGEFIPALGETDFPASGNHIFLHVSETPACFFASSGKVFFNENLHSSW